MCPWYVYLEGRCEAPHSVSGAWALIPLMRPSSPFSSWFLCWGPPLLSPLGSFAEALLSSLLLVPSLRPSSPLSSGFFAEALLSSLLLVPSLRPSYPLSSGFFAEALLSSLLLVPLLRPSCLCTDAAAWFPSAWGQCVIAAPIQPRSSRCKEHSTLRAFGQGKIVIIFWVWRWAAAVLSTMLNLAWYLGQGEGGHSPSALHC